MTTILPLFVALRRADDEGPSTIFKAGDADASVTADDSGDDSANRDDTNDDEDDSGTSALSDMAEEVGAASSAVDTTIACLLSLPLLAAHFFLRKLTVT